jgi:hypothetical protein
VFSVRVKRPESRAGRWWNAAQSVLPLSLPALIVLKLTGVINWSWWWVLSPIWISGILLVLVVCALLIGLHWHARRQTRLWLDQLESGVLRKFLAGNADPDDFDRDLRFRDEGGPGASPPSG